MSTHKSKNYRGNAPEFLFFRQNLMMPVVLLVQDVKNMDALKRKVRGEPFTASLQ
jgi:hypothetical protein